jgi:hypothetical protein
MWRWRRDKEQLANSNWQIAIGFSETPKRSEGALSPKEA